MKLRHFLFLFNVGMFSCHSRTPEHDIILINVDTLNRKDIADEINIIRNLNPKVIAIDLQFSDDANDEYNRSLILALTGCKNLVMASVIEKYTAQEVIYTNGFTQESRSKFTAKAKTGFTNTILEKNEFQRLRQFSIVENVNGKFEYHFAIRTAMEFDSVKSMKFVKGHAKIIDVDYKEGMRRFKTFSSNDVLEKRIAREDVEGKIAIIGFMGPGDEDKFFTPLNTNPDKRDMYGVSYLANVVAQVLESR